MTENDFSRQIVESAIEAHRTLGGPGLLESVYEEALVWELEQRGLPVRRDRNQRKGAETQGRNERKRRSCGNEN